MLRIYDEIEWRRRRRLILVAVFGTGSLFGGLVMNAAPAGSNDLRRPPQPATAECGVATGLKLSCELRAVPR